MLQIPLAWLLLTRDKVRLTVAVAGVAFAVVLMFMQFGFQAALFDSSVALHKCLAGDVFLISPQSISLAGMRCFSQRRLYQALGQSGVQSVSPIYLDFALWKNPETRRTRSILVVAFKPTEQVLNLSEVEQNQKKLTIPDMVLFDESSRTEFGPIAAYVKAGRQVSTEIGNRRVTVAGLFKLGPSFGGDGYVITSDMTFWRLGLHRTRKPGLIDVGAITVARGADPQLVLRNLRSYLPSDVRVLSKQEFLDFEKSYWQESTAIGFIFTLGAFIGFVVGGAIVYQILYADVYEHLSEYATLKAIGYTDRYLLAVVFQEAMLLAAIGFLPALGISWFLYDLTRDATFLPMSMDTGRTLAIFGLTVLMCTASGAIAMRKLSAADPAEVF